MDVIRDTLFLPFRQDAIQTEGKIACMNIAPPDDLYCDIFDDLKRPYPAAPTDTIQNHRFDTIFLAAPHNAIAAQYQMALALDSLNMDGILICAAANKAGGTRLKKWMTAFGMHNVLSESKNKCRVVWGVKNDDTETANAIEQGRMQFNQKTGFTTQPGIFGWNKIDSGSALLTKHLPDNLKGIGADFGCGYGYLSAHVLNHCPNIQTLYALDNDHRAVKAVQHNAPAARAIWFDITRESIPEPLDFIIMNPPFHAGKTLSQSLGTAFIRQTAKALKPKGTVYMVANAHLAYEEILSEHFQSCNKLFETDGFKGFKCVR